MRNPWKLTSFALASMLAVSVGTGAFNTADAEAQPRMRQALTSLKAGLASLQAASHDKGGHRVKAIQLTRSAIEHVEKGIKFDNRH